MPRRKRPRIVFAQFEEKRQEDYTLALAHRQELRVRLMAEFSAEELTTLTVKIRGYVASGRCKALPYRSVGNVDG